MTDDLDRELAEMLSEERRRADVHSANQSVRDAAADMAGIALGALIETVLAEYPKLAELYAADRISFLLTLDDSPAMVFSAVTFDGRAVPIIRRKVES